MNEYEEIRTAILSKWPYLIYSFHRKSVYQIKKEEKHVWNLSCCLLLVGLQKGFEFVIVTVFQIFTTFATIRDNNISKIQALQGNQIKNKFSKEL